MPVLVIGHAAVSVRASPKASPIGYQPRRCHAAGSRFGRSALLDGRLSVQTRRYGAGPSSIVVTPAVAAGSGIVPGACGGERCHCLFAMATLALGDAQRRGRVAATSPPARLATPDAPRIAGSFHRGYPRSRDALPDAPIAERAVPCGLAPSPALSAPPPQRHELRYLSSQRGGRHRLQHVHRLPPRAAK